MAFGRGAAPYTAHRIPLYILLWLASAVLLGLTAFRLHHTKATAGFYDRIVVELLVTSILTLLWIPYALSTTLGQRATAGGTTATTRHHGARHPGLLRELGGNTILWIMWLIGAAIATNKWPTGAFRGFGTQRHILTAILALAWIGWSLFTIIKVLSLMQHAAARGGAYYGTTTGVTGAGAAPGVVGAGEKPGVTTGTTAGGVGGRHAGHTTTGAGYV